MKTITFNILNGFSNFICLLLVITSVDILLAVKMNMDFKISHLLVFAGFMIYYVLVRRIMHHLILFILAHIPPFLVISHLNLQPDFTSKIIIFTIAYSLANFKFWFDDNKRYIINLSPFYIFVILISYLLTYSPESTETVYLFAFTICFVVACLLKNYFSNAYSLAHSGQISKNMPVKEIFHNSSITVIIQCFVATLIMLFFKADNITSLIISYLNKIWSFIGKHILDLLYKIFSNSKTQTFVTNNASSVSFFDTYSSTNPILEKISSLLIIIFTIIILTVIIITIIKIFIEHNKKQITTQNSTFTNEIREKIVIEKPSNRFSFRGLSTGEKIRHLYKKKLIQSKRKGASVLNTNTPKENAIIIKRQSGENIYAPTDIYEAVRYDYTYKPTQEDLENCKQLLKN